MMIFTLMVILVVTMIIGMPIAFGIGMASLVTLWLAGVPFVLISQQIFRGLSSFTMLAIPLFVLAGNIMLKGRITITLLDVADLLVGRIRGGLGHVNIVVSMLFAGITGMAAADTTAIGSVMIPAMVEKGYERDYSTAITIASSVIGPIIPPSLNFVIYALAVGKISIGGLFLAGAIPGVVTGFALMIIHYIISQKRGYEKREYHISFRKALQIFKNGIYALLLPIIIIGGILGGMFTATEAAAVGSLYAFIISFFVYRSIKIEDLPEIFMETVKVSGMIVLILGNSNVFSWILTTQNIPRIIGNALMQATTNQYIFLLFINVILLIIGCLLDTFPAIVIFAPIFHPIAIQYGINPIHFAIIMCVNLLVGLNTPPIGTGLFLGVAVGKTSLEKLVKAVLPFSIIEIIVVLLITYIPILTLWLPNFFGFIQ